MFYGIFGRCFILTFVIFSQRKLIIMFNPNKLVNVTTPDAHRKMFAILGLDGVCQESM